MYVARLLVKGYRSLQDVSIAFHPGLNVLVGKNNAGKSNIISALDIVLGEKWPTYAEFEDRDFYRSPKSMTDDVLLIAVELSGSNYNKLLFEEQHPRAYVWAIPDGPNFNNFDRLAAEPEGRGIWNDSLQLELLLDHAERLYFYVLVPRQGTQKERVLAAYLLAKGKWYHLRRFNAEFRDGLLTTARIPSFRDPAQQLRVTQFTWYGKLIRSLYDLKGERKAQEIKQVQDQLTEMVGEVFDAVTKRLSKDLGRAIFHNKVQFKPGAFTRDDAYKQITMFVDDGLEGPLYDKGSGIQSAIIIGLFQFYCQQFHRGGSLLLAEEPELYLHPQARRAIETLLTDFATNSYQDDSEQSCTCQVIISTHAVEFLRDVEFGNLTCVRKPIGHTRTDVRQIRSTGTSEYRLRQAVRTKNAEMFFADHVILVEGGEEHLLPPLADVLFGERGWLDTHNVSVVRADGKMQFCAYVDILKQMDIGYTILTDLDFIRDGLDDSVCPLDARAKNRLSELRTALNQSVSEAKGRDVKAALSPDSRDWQQLYREVDEAIQSVQLWGEVLDAENVARVGELWDRLRKRLSKPNLKAGIASAGGADGLLLAAKENRVYILSQGELEDYLTEDADQLPGDSKDRKALAVAAKIAECADLDGVRQWIQCDEFVEVLYAVAGALGIPLVDEEEIPW